MCFWIVFAYIPWYANLFYDIKKEPLLNIRIYDPQILIRLFTILITFFADFHIRWQPLLLLIYLPFIVRGGMRLYKERREDFRFLCLFLFLVYLVNFIIIYALTCSYRVRYYSAFSFPLFILLALGLRKIRIRKFLRMALLVIYLIIALLNFSDLKDAFTYSLNEEWKGAAQYIKQIPGYKDKNMIFLFQTKYNPPVFSYYYWNKEVADSYMKNITYYHQDYEDILSAINTEHRVYLMSEQKNDKRLFEKIDCFPDDAWIWLFRYHEFLAYFCLRINNPDKYFLHQIPLNPELPQIDLFLLKRIKK